MSDENTNVIPFPVSEDTVWCEVAQAMVPKCACGPHEQCPEHELNCVYFAEMDRES